MYKTIHINPKIHMALKVEALKLNIPLKDLVEKKLLTPLMQTDAKGKITKVKESKSK